MDNTGANPGIFRVFLDHYFLSFNEAAGAAASLIATKEFEKQGRGVAFVQLSYKDMGPSAPHSNVMTYESKSNILDAIFVPRLAGLIDTYDPRTHYILVVSLDTGGAQFTLVRTQVFALQQPGFETRVEPGHAPPVHYNCAGCRKIIDAKPNYCGSCRTAIYCDKECQRTDWKHHKSNCKNMKALRQTGKNLFS